MRSMRLRRTKHAIRRREVALRLTDGLPRGRVLDAPCGTGELAEQMARRGDQVWAVDLNAATLVARDGVRFDVVDLNGPLPYPDGFFDLIVSLEGLEHLESPARCLGEFARVLRPGGRLVVTTPNVNNLQSRWEYLLTGRFSGFKTLALRGTVRAQGPVSWHITVPYVPTLLYLLTHYGLHVESVGVTMIKSAQWLWLPVAAVMWLAARRRPVGTVGRTLGSWRLLLGRNVVISAAKPR
jgi:SAM-dependent methyltransferase